MRSARLSLVRQATSSRQSPNRPADSAGSALAVLLDATSLPVRRRAPAPRPHFPTWAPSSSSRTGSASPHTTKLVEPGLRAPFWPFTLHKPVTADDQNSTPGLPAYTSSATPRPLSQPQ